MSDYTFGPQVQFDTKELDAIYKRAFGYKTDGFFVEVGAYDGKTYSHTWGLAELGWRGINLEPVPSLYHLCLLNHTNHAGVQNYQVAAGRRNGFTELHVDEFSVCGSTLNQSICKNPKVITAPVRTLDSLLMGETIPHFDLLSIDVEFSECEVLAGFDLSYWLPKLVMIELCEQHDEPKKTWAKPARDLCDEIFPKNGYSKIYSDMINSIYLRNS